MPHRGLARPPRHCSWHSFWSSPIASGTRARAGPACAISPPRLAPSRAASRHVTSRGLVRVQHPRISFKSARTLHLRRASIPKGKEKKYVRRHRYLLPRGKVSTRTIVSSIHLPPRGIPRSVTFNVRLRAYSSAGRSARCNAVQRFLLIERPIESER